jgi:DNA polymerase epsilon subunit 1
MRRQLLAMLHVKEFAKEADFIDPCHSIVVRDLVCTSCRAVTDIDICREAAYATHTVTWHCRSCSSPFDSDLVERRLLTRMSTAVSGFQLQDLTCKRCHVVSTGGMRMQCEQCGESLVHSVTPEVLKMELSVLRSAAHFHGLPLLAETAELYLGDGLPTS